MSLVFSWSARQTWRRGPSNAERAPSPSLNSLVALQEWQNCPQMRHRMEQERRCVLPAQQGRTRVSALRTLALDLRVINNLLATPTPPPPPPSTKQAPEPPSSTAPGSKNGESWICSPTKSPTIFGKSGKSPRPAASPIAAIPTNRLALYKKPLRRAVSIRNDSCRT